MTLTEQDLQMMELDRHVEWLRQTLDELTEENEYGNVSENRDQLLDSKGADANEAERDSVNSGSVEFYE